jgi:hypothetical protein
MSKILLALCVSDRLGPEMCQLFLSRSSVKGGQVTLRTFPKIFISDADPAADIRYVECGCPLPPIPESPKESGVSRRRTNANFTSICSPGDVMTRTSLCDKPEDLPRLVPMNPFVCHHAQHGLGILSTRSSTTESYSDGGGSERGVLKPLIVVLIEASRYLEQAFSDHVERSAMPALITPVNREVRLSECNHRRHRSIKSCCTCGPLFDLGEFVRCSIEVAATAAWSPILHLVVFFLIAPSDRSHVPVSYPRCLPLCRFPCSLAPLNFTDCTFGHT